VRTRALRGIFREKAARSHKKSSISPLPNPQKNKKTHPESHYFQKNTPVSPYRSTKKGALFEQLSSFVANLKQTTTNFLQSCSRAVTTAEFVHAKTSPRWLQRM
jgi:hypothetical protein